MKTLARVLTLTVFLAGCAAPPSTPPQPMPPLQERLRDQNRTALTAFENGRFELAADLYAQALATATAMDDSASIIDAHYNRGVGLMLAERYSDARHSIRRAEDELKRVGRTPPPELILLSATLAYRTGDDAAAWTLTTSLIGGEAPIQPQITDRAWFLRGLLANRRNENRELDRAIVALRGSRNPEMRADRLELEAYRAAAAGDSAGAVTTFDEVSRRRNEFGDYRGMSRSLVAAAEVLDAVGREREAADRYLRAGRSAASLDSTGKARTWLERARELANASNAPGIGEEAQMQLQQIEEAP